MTPIIARQTRGRSRILLFLTILTLFLVLAILSLFRGSRHPGTPLRVDDRFTHLRQVEHIHWGGLLHQRQAVPPET